MPIQLQTFLAPSWATYTPETPCHLANPRRRYPAIILSGLRRYLCKCQHSSSNPVLYDTALKLCQSPLTLRYTNNMIPIYGFHPGEVSDPAGPPAHSLGGLAIVASSVPDWRGEESRKSHCPGMDRHATFSIPSFESISALTVVYVWVGLTEL